MKKQKISAKTVALLAMMIALALVFSYVETLIPINFGIPGVKLGLANLVIVAALYLIGGKEAFLVSVVRIFLSGFMFGNLASIMYSLAGGLLSLAVMLILKKTDKLSILAVSVLGGILPQYRAADRGDPCGGKSETDLLCSGAADLRICYRSADRHRIQSHSAGSQTGLCS